MIFRKYFRVVIYFSLLVCATLCARQASSQRSAGSGSLGGQVTDPSGAAIANANITLVPAGGAAKPIKGRAEGPGEFQFKNVPAGHYTVSVGAPGFSAYKNDGVVIAPGTPLTLNVAMEIQVEQEKVDVSGDT